MLSLELYAQRLQKLIYLHLSTDCFMKISLDLAGPVKFHKYSWINHLHIAYFTFSFALFEGCHTQIASLRDDSQEISFEQRLMLGTSAG